MRTLLGCLSDTRAVPLHLPRVNFPPGVIPDMSYGPILLVY